MPPRRADRSSLGPRQPAGAARLCFALGALAFLRAGLAAAQTITTGAGPVPGVIEIPVDHPAALALFTLALAAFGSWILLNRRGANGTPFLWSGILLLAVWSSPSLRAQVLSQFTNPAGETLPIPIQPIVVQGVLQGFERADFSNAAGADLRILDIQEPTFAECFPLGLADPLPPPGPLAAGLCEVGAILAAGAECSVDVDAICKALAATHAVIDVVPTDLVFAAGTTGLLTVTNDAGSLVAAADVAVVIPGGSSLSVQSTTCAASLAPGASCTITLTAAATEGPTGLTVEGTNSNAVPVTVTVASPPTIAITGPLQQSRVIAVGGAALLLEVTNDAGSAVAALNVTVTDKAAVPNVLVDDSDCVSVAPGASCTLSLTSSTPYAPASITLGGSNTANSPPTVIAFAHLGGLVFEESGGNGKIVIDLAQEFSSQWTSAFFLAGATSLSDGIANTDVIVVAAGCSSDTNNCAAQRCRNVGADWYLPARNELSAAFAALCPNAAIPCNFGGFGASLYWSSSEFDVSNAWALGSPSASVASSSKISLSTVRCTRAFTP